MLEEIILNKNVVHENFCKPKRFSNFELLRVLSMLMIIGAHLACHGIQHCEDQNTIYQIFYRGSLVNKIFTSALNVGGEVGVAIFFMISGYFQIYNKKIKSLTKVILECVFYGWINVFFACLIEITGGVQGLDVQSILFYLLKVIFNPISGGAWWFISSYVLLMILAPNINKILLKLNDKGWIMLLICVWFLWYSMGHIDRSSYYFIQRSILFYILGAFCRIKKSKLNGKIQKIIIPVLWLIGTLLFFLIALYSGQGEGFRMKVISNFFDIIKTSIIVPLCAYLIFRVFESWNLKTISWINISAQTTLGVYLVHDSIIVRNYIWYELIKVDTVLYKSIFFPLYAIIVIIVVFVVCSIIDLIRIKYIEPSMVHYVDQLFVNSKVKWIK